MEERSLFFLVLRCHNTPLPKMEEEPPYIIFLRRQHFEKKEEEEETSQIS